MRRSRAVPYVPRILLGQASPEFGAPVAVSDSAILHSGFWTLSSEFSGLRYLALDGLDRQLRRK